MLRYTLPFFLLACSVLSLHAEYRYRLMLDGKPDSQMTEFSDRAIERRQRQGIALDSTDLQVSPTYQQQLMDAGLKIISRSRWLNSVVVMSPDGKAIDEDLWQTFPFVLSHEEVTTTQHANKAPKFRLEEELQIAIDPATIDECAAPLVEVNARVPLYDAGYRGQGMLIAVLDGGFKNIDKFSWLMNKVVGFCDMYAPQDSISLFRNETHGACCYSIMASSQSHGVFGTAQKADYYLIRTEANDCEVPLEEDMWVAGAELADSIGADLISSSLGYYEFDNPFQKHTYGQFTQDEVFVSRGARIACQKGMLICNAAGNEADNNWKRIIFPSDVEEVFTVGGTNPNLTPAYFTSRGFTTPYVKPNASCRATSCFTLNPDSSTGKPSSNGAGTSYATPLMCGLTASLWSAVPELLPADIRQVIYESANQYAQPDSILGYGVPDFGIALQLAFELAEQRRLAINEIMQDQEPTGFQPQRYNLFGQPVGDNRRTGWIIENGKLKLIKE